MELTREYFDQQLEIKLDHKLKHLATKTDLVEQTTELKAFAVDQKEELARIIATTIAEPMQRHFDGPHTEPDVNAEVFELKRDMLKIKTALHLST